MRAVSITNRGGRPNNEDNICHAVSEGVWCFAVCDGLGGQECGEVASQLVCAEIKKAFLKNPDISEKNVYRYLERAASELGDARSENPDKYNMSTTAAVLVTDGRNAVWAHSGDSRIYRFHRNKITSVTRDHSLAFMEYENGVISYDGIRRSISQNKLTRCISDLDFFNPEVSEVADVSRGDAFLLCSDGFWELVTEADMERCIEKAHSPKEWLEKMLACLHEREGEHNDNYTAVAVML